MKSDNKDSESQNLRQKAEELLKMKPSQTDSSLSAVETVKLIHEFEVHQIELELQNEELFLARSNVQKIAEKYTELYDLAPSGYFTLSNSGEILNLNLCGAQMLGKERSHLKSSRFTLFVSPDTRPIFILFLEKVFQSKIQETCEVKLVTNGDLPIYVMLTGIITENQTQCNITMVDITRGKQAEEKLLFISKAVESAGEAIGISDAQCHHIYQNKAFSDLFGYDTAEELQAAGGGPKTMKDPGVAKELFDTIMKGKPWSGELELVTKSGSVFPAYERADAIIDSERNIIGFIGIIKDITKRKLMEEAMSKQNSMFDSLLKNLQIGVYMIEVPSGKPLLANNASFNLLGRGILPEANASNITQLYDLYHRDSNIPYPNDELPLIVAMGGVSKHVDDMDVVKPDGTRIPLEVFGSPVRDEKGNIWASLASFQDITERKSAENEILLLNKTLEQRIAERINQLATINKELTFHLSELEQFSYVSNHDLQEPLRTLIQFTKLFNEKYAGKLDEEGTKYIEFISKSAVRMNMLVKDLLAYSLLGKESKKSLVDCNKIVEAVLSDLDDSIKRSSAKLTVQELPTVNGYETEMRLLFQNLITNAIKYQKKDIVPEIQISVENHKKEWLFSIKDNGIGIDKKHNEKIFIIFQRLHNRTEFEGTGIGLAHCKKVVEMHNGEIWVESTPGAGSTFMFTIPKQKHV